MSETRLTITWEDDLPETEQVRLGRAWSAAISAKPVVADVRLQHPAGSLSQQAPPERIRLRPARLHPNLGDAKKNYSWYTLRVASKPAWCFGCGADIAIGDMRAQNGNGGSICLECVAVADREAAAS